MLNSHTLDTSIDRSLGEEQTVTGSWFQFIGDVPIGLTVALNDKSHTQIPITPFQIYPAAFRRLFVFHRAGLPVRPMYLVTGSSADTAVAAAPELVQIGPFWEVRRCPNTANVAVIDNTVVASTIDLEFPAINRRLRLFSGRFQITGDATLGVAGRVLYTIQDSSARVFLKREYWLPVASANAFAPAVDPSLIWTNGLPLTDLYNGAALGKLQIVVGTQLTAGHVIFDWQSSIDPA